MKKEDQKKTKVKKENRKLSFAQHRKHSKERVNATKHDSAGFDVTIPCMSSSNHLDLNQ